MIIKSEKTKTLEMYAKGFVEDLFRRTDDHIRSTEKATWIYTFNNSFASELKYSISKIPLIKDRNKILEFIGGNLLEKGKVNLAYQIYKLIGSKKSKYLEKMFPDNNFGVDDRNESALKEFLKNQTF